MSGSHRAEAIAATLLLPGAQPIEFIMDLEDREWRIEDSDPRSAILHREIRSAAGRCGDPHFLSSSLSHEGPALGGLW